jgi:phosphonate transport system substrate-binding protein
MPTGVTESRGLIITLTEKAIMSQTIWLGAVAYDPKVVTIWEGMRRYFHEEARLSVEGVLFQSYEMEVSALLATPSDSAPRIDIAWNTNIACSLLDPISTYYRSNGSLKPCPG